MRFKLNLARAYSCLRASAVGGRQPQFQGRLPCPPRQGEDGRQDQGGLRYEPSECFKSDVMSPGLRRFGVLN